MKNRSTFVKALNGALSLATSMAVLACNLPQEAGDGASDANSDKKDGAILRPGEIGPLEWIGAYQHAEELFADDGFYKDPWVQSTPDYFKTLNSIRSKPIKFTNGWERNLSLYGERAITGSGIGGAVLLTTVRSAVDPNDKFLYVLNSGQALIKRFDLKTGKYMGFIGYYRSASDNPACKHYWNGMSAGWCDADLTGVQNGSLISATDIAMDPKGEFIYVLHQKYPAGRVLKFNAETGALVAWVGQGLSGWQYKTSPSQAYNSTATGGSNVVIPIFNGFEEDGRVFADENHVYISGGGRLTRIDSATGEFRGWIGQLADKSYTNGWTNGGTPRTIPQYAHDYPERYFTLFYPDSSNFFYSRDLGVDFVGNLWISDKRGNLKQIDRTSGRLIKQYKTADFISPQNRNGYAGFEKFTIDRRGAYMYSTSGGSNKIMRIRLSDMSYQGTIAILGPWPAQKAQHCLDMKTYNEQRAYAMSSKFCMANSVPDHGGMGSLVSSNLWTYFLNGLVMDGGNRLYISDYNRVWRFEIGRD